MNIAQYENAAIPVTNSGIDTTYQYILSNEVFNFVLAQETQNLLAIKL